MSDDYAGRLKCGNLPARQYRCRESVEVCHRAERIRPAVYSRLCAIYFTLKLDEVLREQGSGVSVNSFNPGYMAATNFSGGYTDTGRILLPHKSRGKRESYIQYRNSMSKKKKKRSDQCFET